MAELTMTFDIPTSKAIDVQILKKQMMAFYNVVIAMPSVLQKDVTPCGVEQFRGKWKDDRTAEDIIADIYQNRSKQIRESIAL